MTSPTLPDPDEDQVIPLVEPRDGLGEVITDPQTLAAVIEKFANGTGPVAVDAERASGYRYSQRAYLVQLRRQGAGTALIDPIALPDLSGLSQALTGVQWVFHAASQDLPCLAELGMHPDEVFDTELGARLLGFERVGLAAVIAKLLGFGLAKEHSAVDWSTRPLPADWLRYAALDVEVLVEARDVMVGLLADAGKQEWARQEFEAVRTAPAPAPRVDPWRRVSGTHQVHDPERLAVVRQLWYTRDEQAQLRDTAPGRVLPDRAIIAAALALPATEQQMRALPMFNGRRPIRNTDIWFAAVEQGRALPAAQRPTVHAARTDAPPPVRAWADRAPEAAARLAAAKEGLTALSTAYQIPVENILQPDLVRRLMWAPPADVDQVPATLAAGGARQWQIELTEPTMQAALTAAATTD